MKTTLITLWRMLLITGFLAGCLGAAELLSALFKACGWLTTAEPDALLAGCLVALLALTGLAVRACAVLLNASLEGESHAEAQRRGEEGA